MSLGKRKRNLCGTSFYVIRTNMEMNVLIASLIVISSCHLPVRFLPLILSPHPQKQIATPSCDDIQSSRWLFFDSITVSSDNLILNFLHRNLENKKSLFSLILRPAEDRLPLRRHLHKLDTLHCHAWPVLWL